jgi:hypothetical protein
VSPSAKNLAELYELEPLDWASIPARLAQGFPQAPGQGGPGRHSSWLATIDPDGSPHLTGIGTLWHAETFWFETGRTSRKGRNLARDPRCSLSLAVDVFDLVVVGRAEVVTEPDTVAEIARLFAADGWPARVDESGTALTAEFSAPSAGPPPWHVYRVTIERATALQTAEPGGATTWTF